MMRQTQCSSSQACVVQHTEPACMHTFSTALMYHAAGPSSATPHPVEHMPFNKPVTADRSASGQEFAPDPWWLTYVTCYNRVVTQGVGGGALGAKYSFAPSVPAFVVKKYWCRRRCKPINPLAEK